MKIDETNLVVSENKLLEFCGETSGFLSVKTLLIKCCFSPYHLGNFMVWLLLTQVLTLLLDIVTICWHSQQDKDLELLLLRQQVRIPPVKMLIAVLPPRSGTFIGFHNVIG
jgi:hypothetical protein